MSPKETAPAVEAPSYGVGDRLKEAREAKKYSQSEVAAQLRLSKDIVVALEAHDWDGLHGRTYARGYFANYVRFLGLPFDEMMALFNLEYAGTPSDVNLKHVGQKKSASSQSWIVWVLLLAVLGGALAYYFFNMQQQIASEKTSDLPNVNSQFDDSVVEPLSEIDAPIEVSPAFLEPPVIDEAPMQITESAETDDLLVEDPIENEAFTPVTFDVASEPVVELPPEAPVEIKENPSLTVSVTEACWLEITNHQAKVLMSRVLKPNETVTLDAESPLNLLIGKAGVTTVIYDEQSIDLSPYTEGDIARLTVGIES